jgi:hypothetical protein
LKRCRLRQGYGGQGLAEALKRIRRRSFLFS